MRNDNRLRRKRIEGQDPSLIFGIETQGEMEKMVKGSSQLKKKKKKQSNGPNEATT